MQRHAGDGTDGDDADAGQHDEAHQLGLHTESVSHGTLNGNDIRRQCLCVAGKTGGRPSIEASAGAHPRAWTPLLRIRDEGLMHL